MDGEKIMALSKKNKELLKELNGKEITWADYGYVLVKGNKLIKYGKTVYTINSDQKFNILFNNYLRDEYGTTDMKQIMLMEGF